MLLAKVCVVLACFSLVFAATADASDDQGTGATIAQVIVGVFVGALYIVYHFRARIGGLWNNLFSKNGGGKTPTDSDATHSHILRK